MQAQEYLKDKDGYVVVLYGDTPLITSKTISDTINYHRNRQTQPQLLPQFLTIRTDMAE